MSHAPRHSKCWTWSWSSPSARLAERVVQRVGAVQRARDVRAHVDVGAARRARCRTCRRTSRRRAGRPGVSRITAPTCAIASGEHQPCRRCAAASAGSAAERRSGYLAMCASISARSSSGTGVVARSGTSIGSFVEVDGVVPAGDARAVVEARDALAQPAHRSMPPRTGSSIASVAMRSAMYVPRTMSGERLEVHERRVAHVHARGLGRAVGAHEAPSSPRGDSIGKYTSPGGTR